MRIKLVLTVLLCLAVESPASAVVLEYSYAGLPFAGPADNQKNLLPGSTNVMISFLSTSLLSASTTYSYSASSPIFGSMFVSDGRETIFPGAGSFLPTSFIETNGAGDISSWIIVELTGAGRPFSLGNTCCTIPDVPVIYSYNANGSTDATIQNDGFYGIGPNEGYAYNNGEPGTWSVAAVPGPSTWAMMLIGFAGIGLMSYLKSRRLPVSRRYGCRGMY